MSGKPCLIDLSGQWSLSGFDGYGEMTHVRAIPAGLENFAWVEARVPGSVYLDLMRAGWIDDVYAGCNTLAAQWVEQQYWFYRRRFDVPRDLPARRRWLVFDGLDLDAHVFLNGQHVGEHHNAFRPLRIDVTDRLHERDNDLLVRVDAGLLANADRPAGDYYLEVIASSTKRPFLRKPHFACRWDWSPRLINAGITGLVRLEACDLARLAQVTVTPAMSPDHKQAVLHVRGFVENVTDASRPLTLVAAIPGTDIATRTEAMVAPGEAEIRCDLTVEKPRLWWPRSQGEPHLYPVEVTLFCDGRPLDAWTGHTGIRSVEVRQEPAEDRGTLFHLVINGHPIFCKGANWVPADLLWPRVTRNDYDALVALAAECDFNLLRVWGGGRWEDHAFFDACDRLGILVWNDLPFACCQYPGDDPAFCAEVEREVRHNVCELSRHPSLALWCGNNENELGVTDGWIVGRDPAARPDRALSFELLPRVIAEEDNSRPYWPTSPWSPDGAHPNAQHTGDQHPWHVGLGSAKGDFWQYRDDASRFPNEGGLLGPSTPATLRQILPPEQRRVGSRTWLHHDNTQNTWRGEPMIDNMLRLHLCESPRDLRFDDYVRYAGLLHGEALETAIDNWRRRKFESASAVFWMFNDTWPACTSWTPIDYYRRRKPAFWFVKRAFANLRVICVELKDEWGVFVVNDFLEPRPLHVRYGLFALAGGRPVDQGLDLTCPANAAVVAARLPLSDWDAAGVDTHGAFAVLSDATGRELSTHRLFRARFRDLKWTPAAVTCKPHADGLRLQSESFAWSVCLDDTGEHALPANCVDLIPGIERSLPWPSSLPPPTALAANPPQEILHPGRAP